MDCADPFTKAVSKEVVEICGAMTAGLAELPKIHVLVPECEDKLKRLQCQDATQSYDMIAGRTPRRS